MANSEEVLSQLLTIINEVRESHDNAVAADDSLIGSEAAISSRELVEVLLAVEEYAEDELEVEFDWTNDSAMSMKRSPFRTARVLADHLASSRSEAA